MDLREYLLKYLETRTQDKNLFDTHNVYLPFPEKMIPQEFISQIAHISDELTEKQVETISRNIF